MRQDLVDIHDDTCDVRHELGEFVLELVDLFRLASYDDLHPLVFIQQIYLQHEFVP